MPPGIHQEYLACRRGYIDKTESVVGLGHTYNPVDLLAVDNADVKHPCLGNGQTVLMRTSSHMKMSL